MGSCRTRAARGPPPTAVTDANPPDAPRPLAALLRTVGAAAYAGLAAALLALLLALVLPDGLWSAPLAAALVAAVAAVLFGVQVRRVEAALQRAHGDAARVAEAADELPQRDRFLALAEREWARVGRYGGSVAMLLVEVDRLRQVTYRLGPEVADELLRALAREIGKSLRSADCVARFDDAQLAVFLPQADPTGALDVADRVRDGVGQLAVPGMPAGMQLTASIGVTVQRPHHLALVTLVADTVAALHAARQAGGNCVRMAPDGGPWMRPPAGSYGDHPAAREGD